MPRQTNARIAHLFVFAELAGDATRGSFGVTLRGTRVGWDIRVGLLLVRPTNGE